MKNYNIIGDSIDIPASNPPYPTNSFYRISLGSETLGKQKVLVVKVHIYIAGKLIHQKTPGFPVVSKDHVEVFDAIVKRLEDFKNYSK